MVRRSRRAIATPPPSQSHIETQYRRIKTFFNWVVTRGHLERNPMDLIPHPHIDERTIPRVSEREMLSLLQLVNPDRARSDGEWFRMVRNRAVLYLLWDTPGRRNELASLAVGDVLIDAARILVMGKGRRRRQRWMSLGDKTERPGKSRGGCERSRDEDSFSASGRVEG